MSRIVFDIETNGLLDTMTRIHCITAVDRDTRKSYAFNCGEYADGSFAPHDGSIEEGLQFLAKADELIGHNIIRFDFPGIRKVYGWRPKAKVFDTQVASQVIWPNIIDNDMRAEAKGRLPPEFRAKGLMRKHSLKAWGMRLGVMKGDFDPKDFINPETDEPHTWESIGFTPEMDKYARQDPIVTLRLLEKIEEKQYSQECLDLEHAVARILQTQEEYGFAFDYAAAERLTAKLQRRHVELSTELTTLFDAWYMPSVAKGTALHTPKKNRREWVQVEDGPVKRKVKGEWQQGYYVEYTEGAAFSKVKLVVFNPASRDHIADRLMKVRGWKPTQFTDNGKPAVDETTLESLPWPEAKLLTEYLTIEKRLGQVATGKEAWLKHATKAGIFGNANGDVYRIHGEVSTNGAVTGRMTHKRPNVAQTPKADKKVPYGVECRECWTAGPGYVLVGCDAEGLELRMLGHFMARYDEGAYADAVVNGDKDKGTDVHTINQKAIGLNSRNSAKTFIYALIYGAGDYKLGTIVYDDFTDEVRDRFNTKFVGKNKRAMAFKRLGKSRRDRLMENLPALKSLTDDVKDRARKRGSLKGLDGRRLHVRAEHSALNTLLQSGGAIVMKKALVLLDEAVNHIRSAGGVVAFVANIHDEWQMEVTPEHSDEVGKLAAACITRAGEHFKLQCPLAGSYGTGANWAATH